MTKVQKIWLGLSAAMFVIPEVMWGPVGNVVYSFLQNSNNVQILRPNFLMNPDNMSLLLLVLAIQFLGIISSLILVLKYKFNIILKSLVISVIIVLGVITGFVFYIGFSLRHGIGF